MSKKKKEYQRIERKILNLFRAQPKRVFNYKQLASHLETRDTQGRNNIIRVLNILHKQHQLEMIKKGQYRYKAQKIKYHETKLIVLPTGKGKVILEIHEEELLVPKKYLNKGLDGDLVSVSVHRKEDAYVAHVEEIIERNKKEYVGILERQKEYGFVLCRKGSMYTDFFIQPSELSDFKDGEKVVAVFKNWEEGRDAPNGKIIKSLGTPGTSETEIHAILHEYGLPYEFPKDVEQSAETLNCAIDPSEIKRRRDFRKDLTFTIDPITAKDFDDALSFKKLKKGTYEIGIHIADVSHYVQPNSILDQEAYDRATSVYLVDRVVPMLPEVLSNGLCSLRPQEEKYTFSAVFVLDEKATVLEEWYGKTVIYSDYRFSYEEVQHMLEREKPNVDSEASLSGQAYEVPNTVFDALTTLNRFSKNLRSSRMKNGAISFDRVEVNFSLDEENNPDSVFFKTSKDANKLIEEFMLLANKRVAQFMGKQTPRIPFVYRIHDDPDEEKLFNLKQTISSFGYSFNPKGKNVSKEINKLLSDCNGKREQNLIDTLALRSMSKAEYTTDNIGHYGLAFTHYTHFTSPIRRYPDVIVHRLLQDYLEKKKSPPKTTIEEACKHASQREQLATRAERDSIKYMQMVFMEDKVGQEFEGVITGVTDRGMYVEIIENKCEGMIRMVDLKNDYFQYDMQNHSIVGRKTNTVYQLGDPLRIKVKKVNIQRRYLDFITAE